MQAMLLAAGFGTRLRPHTLLRPKPLFPVLNRPLLHILLDMLEAAGCRRIVVNCHHLADQVMASVAGRSRVTVQHEAEILGTGGSLRRALPSFAEEPVLVMNGDIVHDIDLRAVCEFHRSAGNPVTMVLHDCPRFNSVVVREHRVIGFGAQAEDACLLAFTGIHVIEPSVIRMIPGQGFHHIIDLYRQLTRDGITIGVFRADSGYWRDMGTPSDYLQLHRDLLTGAHSLAGAGPVQTPWLHDEDVVLGRDVVLGDWGCLGQGVRLEDDVRLRRCVVWDHTRIPAGSRFADMILAPGLLP